MGMPPAKPPDSEKSAHFTGSKSPRRMHGRQLGWVPMQFAVMARHKYASMSSGHSTSSAFDPPPMNDILDDLKDWLNQLVADAPHRGAGEAPGVEINLVKRAIGEIERLRVIEKSGHPSP